MKPRIGISTSLWSAASENLGDPTQTYDHGKHAYSHCLAQAGALPFFLPTLAPSLADDLLAHVDGLLLSGGHDLDPTHYGQENLFAASVIHPARDAWELALAAAARARCLPILGICRGHQLINAAFGGTLYQDLSLRPATAEHRAISETQPRFHAVRLAPDSALAGILAVSQLHVTSTHHQLIDRVAPGFQATAWAEDGVIEALEYCCDAQWVLSVQWHPELAPLEEASRRLFEAFVARAKERVAG